MRKEEKKALLEEIEIVKRTMDYLGQRYGSSGDLVLLGPSRHVVVRGGKGIVVAKSYRNTESWLAERNNLCEFIKIVKAREEQLNKITGKDVHYIGLPDVDPSIVDARVVDLDRGVTPVVVYDAVQGDLLYQKTLRQEASFEDYLSAAVQIARIQQEGKKNKERLGLENVVTDRKEGSPSTDYFMKRFQDIFIDQLIVYSEIKDIIPESHIQEMMIDWENLVARNLVLAHQAGHTGYYFDGSPRHHIIQPREEGSIVSVDYEYKLITPFLLGVASLVSYGLKKNGKPYLSQDEEQKILDRTLLEARLVGSLKRGEKDKAKMIIGYIKEREKNYSNELAGKDSIEFYRFIGKGDKGGGEGKRENYVMGWPFALLDRNSAWLGHKARYRAVTEFFTQQGIKFETPDIIEQNTIEQRNHLEQILAILGRIKENGNGDNRNDKSQKEAAFRLYNKFEELSQRPYFSQKTS